MFYRKRIRVDTAKYQPQLQPLFDAGMNNYRSRKALELVDTAVEITDLSIDEVKVSKIYLHPLELCTQAIATRFA